MTLKKSYGNLIRKLPINKKKKNWLVRYWKGVILGLLVFISIFFHLSTRDDSIADNQPPELESQEKSLEDQRGLCVGSGGTWKLDTDSNDNCRNIKVIGACCMCSSNQVKDEGRCITQEQSEAQKCESKGGTYEPEIFGNRCAICNACGSRSEGWYDMDTNELIKYANCC